MKKTTKALLTLSCAVLLVAASVMGTLAYLTDHDTANNTFTVGQVHIKLDETDVKPDGTKDTDERVKTNDYKLLPGHEYIKDPTVTVLGGSEASYIKITVSVNKLAELDEIFRKHKITDLTTVIGGYDANEWTYKGTTKDVDANTRTYVFYYKSAVSALEKGEDGKYEDVVLDDLFETITVPGGLTNDEIKTLQYKHTMNDDGTIKWGDEEQLTITVKAYAIQADGFKDVNAAWAAFPTT